MNFDQAWQSARDAVRRLGPDLATALIEKAPEFTLPGVPSVQVTTRLATTVLALRTFRASKQHTRRVFEEGLAENGADIQMPGRAELEARDAERRAFADIQIHLGELKRLQRAVPNDP